MTWTALIVSVAVGLAINEYADFAPWVSRKLASRAARRMYADNAERAEIRAEEWAAVIDDRPGKLFKLFTALSYGLAAELAVLRRRHASASVWRSYLRIMIDGGVTPRAIVNVLAVRMGWLKAAIVVASTIHWPWSLSVIIVTLDDSSATGGTNSLLLDVVLVISTMPLGVVLASVYMKAMGRALLVLVETDRGMRKLLLDAAINDLRPEELKL